MQQNREKEDTNLDLASSWDKRLNKVQSRFFELEKELKSLISSLESEKKEADKSKIPLEIFSSNLGALEALVKYLRENLNFKYKYINEISNKSIGALGKTYASASLKQKEKFVIKDFKNSIDIEILFAEGFTVLANIILFLRDSKAMKFSEIAALLSRNVKSVWTVYHNAKEKKNKKQDENR